MYPIKLNVNPHGWRLFMQRKLDRRFEEFSQKIWQRDEFACQFCGLQSKKHQEVINLDQNYRNNKFANLVTACSLCTQCFFLESVESYGGGVLIYLPEISQNQLNGFCHLLFTAMNTESKYKETAQNAYRNLKLRAEILEDEWGSQLQEPSIFGQLVIESENKALLNKKIFSTIRLLPSRAGFRYQSIDWSRSLTAILQ
ncbi:MAG: HNH endonuclease [Gammaproteobacteria bacterium]|nr:MAG: HNH endonuclease [Gammaproteobacteria bacterium]